MQENELEIIQYDSHYSKEWDLFCAEDRSCFMHKRMFLEYHEARFKDKSLIFFYNNRIIGVFPAAESRDNSFTVVSHPGATYGGLVCTRPKPEFLFLIYSKIVAYYRRQGYKELVCKLVPYIYFYQPNEIEQYVLQMLGFVPHAINLSSTINLNARFECTERRRRSIKKQEKFGLQYLLTNDYLDRFWEILEENLLISHGVAPVHSLDEVRDLINKFPEVIKCAVVMEGNEVLAGTLIFQYNGVFHLQYIAANFRGKKISALDGLFNYLISIAVHQKYQFFDFGISTELNGTYLNSGLFDFKSGFGGGTTLYRSFKLNLD